MLIYTAADSNYCLQAKVLVRSISLSRKSAARLIIVGEGWSDSQKRSVRACADGQMDIDFVTVESSFLQSTKISGFPAATVYNILGPVTFLKDERRALYLDADILVREDLANLWTSSVLNSVGAVIDAHIAWIGSPTMWRPWREESIAPLTPYLNTGMMLIDLEMWREENLTERSLQYLREYSLPCVDQDALNLALNGNFTSIHPRYNLMPYHLLKLLRFVDTVQAQDEIQQAIANPAIVHFHRSFLGKPWNFGCSHPFMNEWRRIATEVEPRWKRRIDSREHLRSLAARVAKVALVEN